MVAEANLRNAGGSGSNSIYVENSRLHKIYLHVSDGMLRDKLFKVQQN